LGLLPAKPRPFPPFDTPDLRLDCFLRKPILSNRTVIDCWFASAPKSEELNLPTFLFPLWDCRGRFMNADFLAVLEFWEREKGINREVLVAAVEEALLSAAKKAVGPARDMR